MGKQLFQRVTFLIVGTLQILFGFLEQLLVECFYVLDGWDGHKPVPAAVTYLVLHIPFLIGTVYVTEFSLKAIVQAESVKALSYLPVSVLYGHCRCEIVKEYLPGNTIQMLKYPLQSFQQTLAVLTR